MATTYEKISTTTLSTATATITFNSFSGYTDLVLVGNFATSTNNTYGMYFQINSDSANNYNSTKLQGNHSGAITARQTSAAGIRFLMSDKTSSSMRNIMIANFNRYASAAQQKSVLIRAGSAEYATDLTYGLWRNTAAITSITLGGDGGQTMSSGSTFTLYGILAA